MPAAKRIPVKPGQIRYLLSLAPYRDQDALAAKIGTSARYLRWMLSGKKPGYKWSGKIWKLYEHHRRKGTPQKPPRRVPRRTRGFVNMAAVVGVLQYIFQPTDAQKIPGRNRPWQDRDTTYVSKERKMRGMFDSWDGFALVMVQGSSDQGTISIRRYKPKGGSQGHHLAFEEERREEADEEYESQTLDEIVERWNTLPPKLVDLVSHLPITDWIDEMAEKLFSEPIYNFWISRSSERPKAGGPGLARSPSDPQTRNVIEANTMLDVESASSDDFQFDMVGMYAFTGWNKKPGKKPPRQ